VVLHELDLAGLDDAILVGHSYGGGVALAVAALAPDRVRGLGGVQLVISDHDRALMNAIEATMAGVAWQRCRVHYADLANRKPLPCNKFPIHIGIVRRSA
jgi:pimeloyl-ACP methyl ester carboxylesterase